MPVSLSPLQDANCTNISPAGATEVDVDDSETFTCEHTLAKAGEFWSNKATAQSGEVRRSTPTRSYAEAQEEPEFTIEKAQRVEGTETAFTGDELTAKLGDTIEYQIKVSNTGNRSLRVLRTVGPQLRRSLARRRNRTGTGRNRDLHLPSRSRSGR